MQEDRQAATLTLRETLQRQQQDAGVKSSGCLPKELFTSCSAAGPSSGNAVVRRNLWRTGITDIKDILGVNYGTNQEATTTWYVDQSPTAGGKDQDAEAFFQVLT